MVLNRGWQGNPNKDRQFYSVTYKVDQQKKKVQRKMKILMMRKALVVLWLKIWTFIYLNEQATMRSI